jgi:hypothetical protein
MAETSRAPTLPAQGEWTRVIVLIPSSPSETPGNSALPPPPASALSESLRRQFSERDWFPVAHHDPYLALAELALRDRAQTTRAAWGLQRMEGIALVIVQPETWPHPLLDDLMKAARRCVNDATIWTVTDEVIERAATPSAALSTIRANDFAPDASPTPAPVGSSRSAISSSPQPGSAPADNDGHMRTQGSDVDRMARLNRDEIDMLLSAGDEPDEVGPTPEQGGSS